MPYFNLSWALAPRQSGFPCHKHRKERFLKHRPKKRIRDYFALPSNVLNWYTYYGKVPGPSSWAWSFFPDGGLWKRATAKHGESALTVVLDKYRPSDKPSLQTAFSPDISATNGRNSSNNATMVDDESIVDSPWSNMQAIDGTADADVKGEHAIFFHIALPSSTDPLYKAEMEVLSRQCQVIAQELSALQQPSSSATNVSFPVYFTLGVNNDDTAAQEDVFQLCEAQSLDCIPLGSGMVEREYIGETLWHTHGYCTSFPSSSITYLSNLVPDDSIPLDDRIDPAARERQVLIATRGALNPACWNIGATQCSTCGATFRTSAKLHYRGNMFSAQCQYIRTLLPPTVFEKKMSSWGGAAVVATVREQLILPGIAKDFTSLASLIGIDHHAVGHWVGSHPAIVPCDISWPNATNATNATANATLVDWSRSRRDVEGKEYASVLPEDNKDRLRQYSLLPGNLMKWDYLYQEAPLDDSWIWREFPDGAFWKELVHEFGPTKAVDESVTRLMKRLE